MEEKKKGKAPDFKGDGVSIWKNFDKNGNIYLSVRLVWIPNISFNCFPVLDRNVTEKTKEKEEEKQPKEERVL